MPTEKTYTIEQMRSLPNLGPGALAGDMVDAWQVRDTVTTDAISWRVFEEWFHALPAKAKERGLYRLVDHADTYAGGSYTEYLVEPSWTVTDVPIPAKPDDVEEAEPEAVA